MKFESYYSAGNACSPARATLATGLYPHQEWLLATRTAAGPALQPNFPTYGKLLQALRLPDALHRQVASVKPAVTTASAATSTTTASRGSPTRIPTGTNGQGEDGGRLTSPHRRSSGCRRNSRSDVALLPHRQLRQPTRQAVLLGRLGGRRYYEKLFEGSDLKPFITGYKSVPGEDNPPPHGYPELPSNWESYAELTDARQAASQQLFRSFQEVVWGGAPDDPDRHGVLGPAVADRATAARRRDRARSDYWQRGLDMYTLVQRMVDEQIGKVIAGGPREPARQYGVRVRVRPRRVRRGARAAVGQVGHGLRGGDPYPADRHRPERPVHQAGPTSRAGSWPRASTWRRCW